MSLGGDLYYGSHTYSNNAILNNYNNPECTGGTNTIIYKKETLNSYMNSMGFANNSEADKYLDYYNKYMRESRNYYGTDDPKLIGIPDDTEEYFPEVYESFLTLDSPEIENIYPLMTEAYVTNEKGERIENAYPGQSLLVHVKFNRDKNNNVIRLKIAVRHKENAYMLGDVNNDGKINAVEASEVLTYYAMISTNQNGDFNEAQKLAADVNYDGKINAVDASCILSYYAYTSTAKEAIVSLKEYLKKNS
ncbi:dockerin type I domain-containing protein [Ruminococcus sp.]|uniref:dockerin type I domain-containing protein n=1 Tax=Ruminococcus sp. TaxID=41978 RepID=UPI0025D461C0|nr:dockerin type I domain-containing protein [Ruminococcus sp.]